MTRRSRPNMSPREIKKIKLQREEMTRIVVNWIDDKMNYLAAMSANEQVTAVWPRCERRHYSATLPVRNLAGGARHEHLHGGLRAQTLHRGGAEHKSTRLRERMAWRMSTRACGWGPTANELRCVDENNGRGCMSVTRLDNPFDNASNTFPGDHCGHLSSLLKNAICIIPLCNRRSI